MPPPILLRSGFAFDHGVTPVRAFPSLVRCEIAMDQFPSPADLWQRYLARKGIAPGRGAGLCAGLRPRQARALLPAERGEPLDCGGHEGAIADPAGDGEGTGKTAASAGAARFGAYVARAAHKKLKIGSKKYQGTASAPAGNAVPLCVAQQVEESRRGPDQYSIQ
jgi:hypothetical protein